MNWAWLKTEYPFEKTTKEKSHTIVYILIFTSLLLLLLQPFGFTPTNRLSYFLGFLIVAFLSLSINYFGFPYFFPAFFEESRWSISKGILFLFYNFLLIGLWHYIFNGLFNTKNIFFNQSWVEFIEVLLKTLGIGFVAAVFLILNRYNFLARKHLQISQELNQQLQVQLGLSGTPNEGIIIELLLENNRITFHRNDLKYVSAEGNYIALHFRNREKKSPRLFRATMKQINDALLGFPEFFRCHRSFIINLNAIESSKGNSQGLFIKIYGETENIPVARPKIKPFRDKLQQPPFQKSLLGIYPSG